jgi:hypothetical protein
MLLLVTQAMPQMWAHDHPNLGRLVTPRHYCSLEQMEDWPWAADNDCFNGGLDAAAYFDMLDALRDRAPVGDCLFVTVPDAVADPIGTLRGWLRWSEGVRRRGLPLGFVAQDGCERGLVPPWWSFDALFVGGSTEWKLGPDAERLVREAKERGKWVHVGRVNSAKRIAYAASIGCDSVDGTQWVMFRDTYLDWGLSLVGEPRQERLLL